MARHPQLNSLWKVALALLGAALLTGLLLRTGLVRAQTPTFQAGINVAFSPTSIGPGAVSTLTVKVINSNAFPLTLSTSPVAWSDTLPDPLSFASPANASTTCGGTVTMVGKTLSLLGGSVPAKTGGIPGECVVTVSVTSITPGTHITTIPANTVAATDPDETLAITNPTPASASLLVATMTTPTIGMSFTQNIVYVGANSTYTITLRNRDTNYALTGLTIANTLPAGVIFSSAPAASQCNGGTVATSYDAGTDRYTISLTGGSLAKASNASTPTTCNITATVKSNAANVYSSLIPAGALTNNQGMSNTSAASATLTVQVLRVDKSFSPVNFQVGAFSTATITLRNPTATTYTGVGFTDTLPSGLTVLEAPTTPQCGGTITAAAGGQTVRLSGGTIPSGTSGSPGSCSVVFKVTSNTAATYTNTIGSSGVTTTQGASNISSGSANIMVYGDGEGVTVRKYFNDMTSYAIQVGGNSKLTLSFTAPADTDLTNFNVYDALPDGLVISNSTPWAKNGNCKNNPTLTANTGGTFISLTGATITRNTACQIDVYVTSSIPAKYTNTISAANISNNEHRNTSTNVSADLRVSGLSVAQAFLPTTVNTGGVSRLRITFNNDNLVQLDDLALNDAALVSGISVNNTLPSPVTANTCGGTVTAAVGTRSIKLSGGVLPAKVGSTTGTCYIDVDVKATGGAGTYNTTIAADKVSATMHGSGESVTNAAQSQISLTVGSVTIGVVKSFTPNTVFGGSVSVLTVTLTNNSASTSLTGITFTDALPQGEKGGIHVANPPDISTGACGGMLTAVPGATSITYTGGTLAPSGTCDIKVSVNMNVNNNLTNVIPAGGVTTANLASNTMDVAASLTNQPGLSLAKSFSPNPVLTGPGQISTLTITISNLGNVPATGMGLVDTLQPGMFVESAPAPEDNTCGGTLTANPGDTSIQLAGGSLDGVADLGDPAKTCIIKIKLRGDAATGFSAGSYPNCLAAGSLVTDDGASNSQGTCDTLKVVSPPTISKAFAASPVAAGQTVGLTFTLTNPAGNTDTLTGVGFTDSFPAGMTLASVPNAAQCGGTVTSSADSVTLSGGTLAVGGSCTVTASVKASPGGVYANTSDPVTSTNGGTGTAATASLTVVSPPQIAKHFDPNPISVGGTSTLTFTLTNPAENTVGLSGVAFSDTFPAGITTALAPAASQCNGGTVTSTTGSLSLAGGSLAAGGSCDVTVNVTAGGGSYANTTSPVSSSNGGTGLTASDTLAVQGAGLTLDKTAPVLGFQSAGQVITYSYLLTNSGDVDLFAPFQVTDNRLNGGLPFACAGPATLLPGEHFTCTADYTVTGGDVTAKSISNTATATAIDDEISAHTISSNSDSLTLPLAALTLRKTTTSTGYRAAGNTIPYSYTLTNSGSMTLYPPFEISDDRIGLPPGTAFTCGSASSLAPGANLTCAAIYTIVPADLSAPGYVQNTAVGRAKDKAVGGATVTSPTASVTVYKVIAPTIAKVYSPNPVPVGAVSTLTFTLTNPASNVVPLTGVNFSDTLAAGLVLAESVEANQCGGTVTGALGAATVGFSGGTVLPNSSCTVTAKVVATSRGSYTHASGAVGSTNGGSGGTASATLVVVAPPTITKAFSPTSILVGGTSTLTFTITNVDPLSALTGVAFNDPLPAGVEVAAAPTAAQCGGTVAATATSVSLSGGQIAAGGTCTVTAQVIGRTIGAKSNTTGAITSTQGGTGTTSNTAILTVDQPGLTLAKSIVSGSPYDAVGDVIQYDYRVENTGNVTLIGNGTGGLFTVTDNKAAVTCPATPTGLESGASITCTASHTVTQADLDAGSVTNTARAHGLFNAIPIDSNEDYETATAVQTPELSLAKVISSGGLYSAVGDEVAYRYELTNTGNVTLQGAGAGGAFTVDDDKTSVTCPASPVSLAPGAGVNCTATYTIDQDDLDAKSVTNTAVAHARFGATPIDSDPDSRTASGDPTPVLTLEKSITSGNPFTHAGGEVAYSYLLTNTGNVTLRGKGAGGAFTVTDDKTTVACPATPVQLAPGESVTCTAAYTITALDMTNESVTNTAVAHALEPGGVDVDSAADTATADVERAAIHGLVYLDNDLSGTRELSELGLGGVTISLYDSTGATLLATAVSAVDGSFAFTNLLPRTYRVVETEPDGYVSTTDNTLTVSLAPGGSGTADFGEFSLDSGFVPGMGGTGSVGGLVYADANSNGAQDPGETALAGVTINLLDAVGAGVDSALTGPDGRYLFSGLPAGSYRVVETDLAGYLSTTLNHVGVTVLPGVTEEVLFGDVFSAAVLTDPAVANSVSPATVKRGGRAVFTITVGNNSASDATDVLLTDTSPTFLDIVSVTVSPDEGFPVTITGNSFTINFGTVEPTDVYTVKVLAAVNSSKAAASENLAVITTTSASDLLINNSAAVALKLATNKGGGDEEEDQNRLPLTGFAPGVVSRLPERPALNPEQSTGLEIEIPALGLRTTIVGLAKDGPTWDVTWLGDHLGYLNGTAYPTFEGNSVITGHVYGADGRPGPFVHLDRLKWGDAIILHSYGQRFIYEIRAVNEVDPRDTSAFAHRDHAWVTLVTCKEYDEKTGGYLKRVLAEAVLVRVE